MRRARVFVNNEPAGIFEELQKGQAYRFAYDSEYAGLPVSLSMPLTKREYLYQRFPPFFDGLLPEGTQLEGLLRHRKLDASDYFAQLMAVGADLVGAVSVKEVDLA